MNQAEDGSFHTEWNLCSPFPIMHVLQATATCGHFCPADVISVRRRCVDYLLRHRRPDGGWAIHPDDHSTHSLSTAYAIGALAMIGYPLAAHELHRSAELVLASQRDDGTFEAPADSIGPRPFIVDVPALATVYSLWALSRVRDALTATPHRSDRSESPANAFGPLDRVDGRRLAQRSSARPPQRGRPE